MSVRRCLELLTVMWHCDNITIQFTYQSLLLHLLSSDTSLVVLTENSETFLQQPTRLLTTTTTSIHLVSRLRIWISSPFLHDVVEILKWIIKTPTRKTLLTSKLRLPVSSWILLMISDTSISVGLCPHRLMAAWQIVIRSNIT